MLTFRLHGTIPAAAARELQAARAQPLPAGTSHHRAQKQFFARFDAVLDRGPSGPRFFEDEKVAEVLAGEILMLAETGFVVHGFAILPNHAHLVLHLPASSGLSFAKALDLLHLRTGTACRHLLRPKLPPEAEFWQTGWLEVPLLDAAELAGALAYVHSNARAAGQPARFQAWPYLNE
ncbi:hypothetical protein EAH73_18585 [Hymenobacter nivis]|uniref:Transposase IS200-like domain-containing protein n=1 Tax=Hymenobacter nivis TaxID=1850093 RepID=A0A502GMH5_9BACT|nr:hypothetical protein EAH73_18585 [Hymenobacter nivis]